MKVLIVSEFLDKTLALTVEKEFREKKFLDNTICHNIHEVDDVKRFNYCAVVSKGIFATWKIDLEKRGFRGSFLRCWKK